MFQPERYYSEDYGWRVREHMHVIEWVHLKDGISMFSCECTENYVGKDKVVGAMIMAHRMEIFPQVRERLAASR